MPPLLTETKAVLAAPLVLHTPPDLMSDIQLYEFCQRNRDLRIEQTAEGDILIMPPTGGETGDRNSELNLQLRLWAKQDGAGVAFDSSTGFILPNGAKRSPDASWVARLGWLIDPVERQVHLYRPGSPVEHLDGPAALSGDPELSGFALDLTTIWTPDF